MSLSLHPPVPPTLWLFVTQSPRLSVSPYLCPSILPSLRLSALCPPSFFPTNGAEYYIRNIQCQTLLWPFMYRTINLKERRNTSFSLCFVYGILHCFVSSYVILGSIIVIFVCHSRYYFRGHRMSFVVPNFGIFIWLYRFVYIFIRIFK